MPANRALRTLFALLLCLAALVATPARADADYGDIWYEGTSAGGWGVNFAQNDTTIFATFFVSDSNNNPTWFIAQMLRSSDGVYSGPLYVTTGDYYAHSPYDQTKNSETLVGTATFTATDVNHGILNYTVQIGSAPVITVNKTILRQTLVALPLGGNYLGFIAVNDGSSCSGGSSSAFVAYQFVVTEVTSPANLEIDFVNTDSPFNTQCSMTGPAQQFGKVADIPAATYTCGGVTQNPVHVYDIRQLSNGGIEFRWQTLSGYSCVENGYSSAIPQS
jgi:hypothetical protein